VNLRFERGFSGAGCRRGGGIAGVPADGGAEEFGGALETEFFADISAMDLDGLDADVEGVCDFASGAAETEVVEDFEFAVAERGKVELLQGGEIRLFDTEEGADGVANPASGLALEEAS